HVSAQPLPTALMASIGLVLTVGCTSSSTLSMPTPTSTSSPQPAKALATLAVSAFVLEFQGVYDNVYYYRPQLILSETSGQSGATLKSIPFMMSDGDSDIVSGPGCFIKSGSDRVPAGGIWSVDAVYYYCLDLATRMDFSRTAPTVMINFADDSGTSG